MKYNKKFLEYLKEKYDICSEELETETLFYFDIEYDMDTCMAIESYNDDYEEEIPTKIQYVLREGIILAILKEWEKQ